MHILITGGTGFIGSELRSRLLRNGHMLTIVTRSPDRYEGEQAKNQQFIGWDDDFVSVMETTDAVINLAGENIFGQRWTSEIKKRMRDSRIKNTRRLVQAIEKAKNRPQVMISASGVDYYGDRGDDILDESEPPGQSFLSRLCVDWEQAARPVKELGVRLAISRTGVVLETEGGAMEQMLPPFRFFVGGSIGSGNQYFPWVHMHDYCRAVMYILENEEMEGEFNINSPNPVPMKEFTDVLGEVMHRPSFFRVPEFALKLVLGEATDPILSSHRVQPKRLQQAGFEFKFEDLREALSDIL